LSDQRGIGFDLDNKFSCTETHHCPFYTLAVERALKAECTLKAIKADLEVKRREAISNNQTELVKAYEHYLLSYLTQTIEDTHGE
jgi:hypothetical protein